MKIRLKPFVGLLLTLGLLSFNCESKPIGYSETTTAEVPDTLGSAITPQDDNDNRVYQLVDQMPVFNGGNKALKKWIVNNLVYPQVAMKNGIQGRVIVTFVIERDGSVSDVKMLRSVDPSLDKEAIRLVKSMPKWIPGKKDGASVRTQYTLPVMFRLTS